MAPPKKPSVPKIDWRLDLGPRTVWHKYEKDPLPTEGFRAHARKTKISLQCTKGTKEVGPQVATNGTTGAKINWHLDLSPMHI